MSGVVPLQDFCVSCNWNRRHLAKYLSKHTTSELANMIPGKEI